MAGVLIALALAGALALAATRVPRQQPRELPAYAGCTCGYDPCLAPGICYLIES